MVTYDGLFNFVSMLSAVITMVVLIMNNKKK